MSVLSTGPRPDFYTLGGALKPTAPSYVVRAADEQLLAAVKNREFCFVLTPRQMGKSSLMVRTAASLRESGFGTVIIDLTGIGVNVTQEEWYLGHLRRITKDLRLEVDYQAWWRQRAEGPVQRFADFLTDVVLKASEQPVAIFIDEIDTTLSVKFSDDYFAAIRALYNQRASDPNLDRLVFVLLGVASPSDLIKDPARTPFNIGTRIPLSDFSRAEAQPLAAALTPISKIGSELLDRIFFWTAGHPYLTQNACRAVAERTQSQQAGNRVDEVVNELFFTEGGRNSDSNLQFVRDRILGSAEGSAALELYRRIRRREVVYDDELDPVRSALKLSGLIKVTDGRQLEVRNAVYERVFDREWVVQFTSNDPRTSVWDGISSLFRSFGLTRRWKYDTFISYSRRDSEWVQHVLLPRLERAGIRVFLDVRNIAAGESWRSILEEAILQSGSVTVVLSQAYSSSNAAELELSYLSRNNSSSSQKIIPVRIEECAVPRALAGFRWLDMSRDGHQFEEAVQQLVRAIRR